MPRRSWSKAPMSMSVATAATTCTMPSSLAPPSSAPPPPPAPVSAPAPPPPPPHAHAAPVEDSSATLPRWRMLLRLNVVQRVLSAVVLAPTVTAFLWLSPAFATATVCSFLTSLCAHEFSWLAFRIHRRLRPHMRRLVASSSSSSLHGCVACRARTVAASSPRHANGVVLLPHRGHHHHHHQAAPYDHDSSSTASHGSDSVRQTSDPDDLPRRRSSYHRPDQDTIATEAQAIHGDTQDAITATTEEDAAATAQQQGLPGEDGEDGEDDGALTRCAVTALADRFCGGRCWLAASVLSVLVCCITTPLFLFLVAQWVPRLDATEFYDNRVVYALTTDFVAALCACFAPDWKYAAIVFAENSVFTILTMYSTVCPMNRAHCGMHFEPIQVLLLAMLLLLVFRFRSCRHAHDALLLFALDVLGFVYIIGTLSVLVAFVDDEKRTLYRKLLIVLLYVTWASDSGAYFTGKLLQAIHYPWYHPLASHLSRNKDYEGTLGAILWGVAAMLLASHVLDVEGGYSTKVAFTVLGVVIGRFGDLFESLLKRAAGVKDSGKLIPGHGGVLDRIDALLFVTLVFARYYAIAIRDD